MWDSKEEMMEWTKQRARDLMIVLVHRTSSKYCVDFVCDRFGKPRSGRPKVNLKNPELPVPRLRH